MPLLASFIGVLFSGLTSVFGAFFALALARKAAAYTVLITVFGAFLAATFVCVSSLWSMAAGYFSNSGECPRWAARLRSGWGLSFRRMRPPFYRAARRSGSPAKCTKSKRPGL